MKFKNRLIGRKLNYMNMKPENWGVVKIIRTPKCSSEKLLKYSKQLDKVPPFGYEYTTKYRHGYISSLKINKLINNNEAKWLMKVYVNPIDTNDGLATRYAINEKGKVVNYNCDLLPIIDDDL